MIYGSVCSGIEAATAAWHSLGWRPSFFSEIEDFPRAVLQYHYPGVPLHGDFTTIEENQYEPIDLLVGGTPCQSFSIAGLRGGLDDDRGNLALEFLRLAQQTRSQWIVWENVPGVLSSNSGRDFGSFLGALGEIGYGFAYRVCDAQYWGVAQRRRRVFVVGYLGDWRRAAAVLFERESLSGNPAPSRKAGEKVAGVTPFGIGERGETAHCLRAGASRADKHESTTYAVACNKVAASLEVSSGSDPELMATLCAKDSEKWGCNQWGDEGKAVVTYPINTQIGLRGPDTSNSSREGLGIGNAGDPSYTLLAGRPHAVAFAENQQADVYEMEVTNALAGNGGKPGQGYQAVREGLNVRRLTPTECERLQGFPDGFTQIPYRNKPAEKCPDGPRYKALGNSMAVPVMRWIGERIQMMEVCE